MTDAFGRSILILAPHPGDEVVACHAAAGRARAAGAVLQVLYLTHGCPEREGVWPWLRSRYDERLADRRHEAEMVAAEAGLRAGRWPTRAVGRLWRELPAVEREVREVARTHGVDQLWIPAFEGASPDADGANAVASRFAATGMSVLEFAGLNFAGGRPHSNSFPQPTGDEQPLVLSSAEQAAKLRALGLHASQASALRQATARLEIFRPLPVHDYRRPPHPGRLWYARPGRNPFAGPRPERTDPDDVAAAIKAFLTTDPPEPINPRLTTTADPVSRLP